MVVHVTLCKLPCGLPVWLRGRALRLASWKSGGSLGCGARWGPLSAPANMNATSCPASSSMASAVAGLPGPQQAAITRGRSTTSSPLSVWTMRYCAPCAQSLTRWHLLMCGASSGRTKHGLRGSGAAWGHSRPPSCAGGHTSTTPSLCGPCGTTYLNGCFCVMICAFGTTRC